jgi:hypothetical protein
MDGLGFDERGKRGSSVYRRSPVIRRHWIPAFAGMTKAVGFTLTDVPSGQGPTGALVLA